MDANRALVSKLVNSGRTSYLDEAMEAGVTAQRLGEFYEDCAAVFSFVQAHLAQYGRMPTVPVVIEAHPKFTFEITEEPWTYVLDRWKLTYARKEAVEFVMDELAPATNDWDRIPDFPEMLRRKADELDAIALGKRRRLTLTESESVVAETVTWFWQYDGVGWIPNDALSVLVGDPGEGKGLFGAWLAAMATGIGVNVGVLGHEDTKGLQRGRL
jgi:hypothetical protein